MSSNPVKIFVVIVGILLGIVMGAAFIYLVPAEAPPLTYEQF